MKAVDVARIRTQVRLAQLAGLGIIAEDEVGQVTSAALGTPEREVIAALADLENAQQHLGSAIDKLNADKPPRERG